MLSDALVVLGLGQNLVVLAIGEDEDRALDATHELLDDYAARSVAEHAAQHLFQFLLRLVEGGEDEYALAGTQAVGLQDIGCLERFQEGQSFLKVFTIEGLIACGGDVVALHESLGEILGTFQHGTGFRGTDDGDVLRAGVGLQVVVDALHQRIFGTNHHHVDLLFDAECLDGLKVVGLHADILATIGCPGIAWGDIQFLTFLTLSDFPGQCVLTTAAA